MLEQETPQVAEETGTPEAAGKKWAEFIETAVVDFFFCNKLEKLSLEDGKGNKAKLSRTKDNDVKLEYATTKLL